MIAYLKGNILRLTPDSAVIEAGGVGYEVFCSGSAHERLSGKKQGEVYTYLQVKEDGVTLFGFSSWEEKNLFLQLISVSGVGPKMGIAILSQLSAADAATAIATADIKRLSSVKGLGKKTAERLVLELKEKMGIAASGPAVSAAEVPSAGDEDAIVALMTLGFSRAEAMRGVAKAKGSGADTTEAVIMAALKAM